jgi:hypothetical protein
MKVPMRTGLRLDTLIELTCLEIEARQRRQAAEQLKAELKAKHAAGPDEFLSDVLPGPQGSRGSCNSVAIRFGPILPAAVRRQIERGEQLAREAGIGSGSGSSKPLNFRSFRWISDLPEFKRRKHRATGKKCGHPLYDDAGLAIVVRELVQVFGAKQLDAKRTVARSLTPYLSQEAAMARVRRALARTPAHRRGAIQNVRVRLF